MCERLKKQVTKTPVEKPSCLHRIHQINGDTPPHDKLMSSAFITFCHNMSRAADDSPVSARLPFVSDVVSVVKLHIRLSRAHDRLKLYKENSMKLM